METAWGQASPRFQAYQLVLPGSPSFICQPVTCTAYCCHAFSVSLGDAEVGRLQATHNLPLNRTVELDEGGEPLALPMVQPYLLARDDGHCRFLADDLGCSVYEGRPNACRLYPHFVVFWDEARKHALTNATPQTHSATAKLLAGEVAGLIPLLLGHIECPGFTGPLISGPEWRELFVSTCQLQYPAM